MMDFITIAWAVLLMGGGITWGYFLLRLGWPKIRILDDSYKLGWSFLLGLGFFALVSMLTFGYLTGVDTLAKPLLVGGSLCVAGFPVAVLLIYAYRQFFTPQKVMVSISPEVAQAHDTANRLVEKMSAAESGITNDELTRQQLEEIKRALAKALKEGSDSP